MLRCTRSRGSRRRQSSNRPAIRKLLLACEHDFEPDSIDALKFVLSRLLQSCAGREARAFPSRYATESDYRTVSTAAASSSRRIMRERISLHRSDRTRVESRRIQQTSPLGCRRSLPPRDHQHIEVAHPAFLGSATSASVHRGTGRKMPVGISSLSLQRACLSRAPRACRLISDTPRGRRQSGTVKYRSAWDRHVLLHTCCAITARNGGECWSLNRRLSGPPELAQSDGGECAAAADRNEWAIRRLAGAFILASAMWFWSSETRTRTPE